MRQLLTSSYAGIFFMTIAMLGFSSNDVLLKLSTSTIPPFEAIFLRGVAASFWCIPLVFLTKTYRQLWQMTNKHVLVRNGFEMIAIIFFILALANLPIANVTAMLMVTPLLMVLAAGVIQKEKIGVLSWSLIALGFAGALMIAQPGGTGFSIYVVCGFCVAIATAGRDFAGRYVAKTVPGPVVVVCAILMGTAFSGGVTLAFEHWVWPQLTEMAYFMGAGLFLVFGHFGVFMAFRHGDLSLTAPFFFTSMIWALLYGLLVFGTVPNSVALLGMLFILISGVAITRVAHTRRQKVAVRV